jgi:hypothetical protein
MTNNREPKKSTEKKPAPRKMDHQNPRQTASIHPRPFESPLWKHLDAIRQMRVARKTWAQIAEHIGKAEGRAISFTTVHNFFRRAAERQKKGKGLFPLGYSDPFTNEPQNPSPPASPDDPEPTASPKTTKEKLLQRKEFNPWKVQKPKP